MKRLLVLVLVVLLLAGCTGEPVQTTDGTDAPATLEPTVGEPAPVPYDPDSALQQQTNGAVFVYTLDKRCLDIGILGSELLMSFDMDVSHTASIGEMVWSNVVVTESVSELQMTGTGFWYYVETDRVVVTVSADLQTQRRISLPEELLGAPAVSEDLETVYYCTAEGIRALGVETGIARLLRQEAGFTGIEGIRFGGEMLVCNTEDGVAFIMSETGIQVDDDETLHFVDTYEEQFFLLRDGEEAAEYLYGTRGGDTRVFLAPADRTVLSALELNSVVTAREQHGNTTLELYDLDSGLRTASVLLESVTSLRSMVADPKTGCIWFLAAAAPYEENVLLCWDPVLSPVEDETIYTAPRYTAASPDLIGLAACADRAKAMGEPLGLDIRVWTDAVQAPWVSAEAEYRVSVTEKGLDTLESLLTQFPDGMLAQLGDICDSGSVSISLVTDAGEGTADQVWLDGNACIVLELGSDMEKSLYYSLYRVMDTYVLGQNSMLDEWDAENPALARAELFTNAMTAGMEEYFQTKSTQKELEILCKAIRDAFGLKKYEGILPWEQYLNK